MADTLECAGSVQIQLAALKLMRGQRDIAPPFVRDAIGREITKKVIRTADAVSALVLEQPCLLPGCSCMEDHRL